MSKIVENIMAKIDLIKSDKTKYPKTRKNILSVLEKRLEQEFEKELLA